MAKHLFFKSFFLTFCLFLLSQSLVAQDILKGKDLSQIKVDQLSDADILKLKTQLTSAGMTIDQAEQMSISKGMTQSEFAKLKKRLETVGGENKRRCWKIKIKTGLK